MNYQHSFRNAELSHKVGVRHAEKNGSTAFVHDVCQGLPEVYQNCDIMFVGASWQLGYSIFAERANASSTSYNQYSDAIAQIVSERHCPIILLVAKNVIKRIGYADSRTTITYNRHREIIYGYGIDVDTLQVNSDQQLVARLALTYDCIGDFSCGYGNTGRAFYEAGKRFVMSDINEKCITYIADHILADSI